MSITNSVLTVLSILAVATSFYIAENQSNLQTQDEATMHFFVLMVPEHSVRALKMKARQEEEGIGTLTETGTYVGQIISGVLGGDVRPIFAGSASFIDEPDVQQGVSTILANVAPSINNVLKQWVSRVQTALGISTTLKPGSVVLSNQTRPSNGVVVGRPISASQATRLTPQQILQQQKLAQQQQAQVTGYKPVETVAGSNVLTGNNLYDLTTVEPLPIINPAKITGDEDDGEEVDLLKIV